MTQRGIIRTGYTLSRATEHINGVEITIWCLLTTPDDVWTRG